ncbi:MAG: division/cell wall cluster transcriptional repressor MraZ [Pseudomonadota bacterium]
MARRFKGESVHKVDQKGRVSVPASFRRVLAEGDPDWNAGTHPTFVLIYGLPGRPHLEGYTINGMEELDDMVARMPRFSRERRAIEHALSTKSSYLQVDDNGRMILPAKLREVAGLNDEAVFAGMGDHFQVWSPEGYDADCAMHEETLEQAGGEQALENIFSGLENRPAGEAE